jgi:hypothetical protein
MIDIQQKRLQMDRDLFGRVTSPDKAAANNLFSFLANRLMGSFTNLGCGDLLHMNNPVTVQMKNGVVVDATFFGKGTPATATPTAGTQPKNRHGDNGENNGWTGTSASPVPPNGVTPSATATPSTTATPRTTAAPSTTQDPGVPASSTPAVTPDPASPRDTPASTVNPASPKDKPASTAGAGSTAAGAPPATAGPKTPATTGATRAPDTRPAPNTGGDGTTPKNGKS